MIETIHFSGSSNISATHTTTLEITKKRSLTNRGNCIIGIAADKSCATIGRRVKDAIRDGQILQLTIVVGEISFGFLAYGDGRLRLSDSDELVIRKSDFISPRTLAVRSSAAAIDIPRKIISLLQAGSSGVLMIEI